jgi:hypothetical protein
MGSFRLRVFSMGGVRRLAPDGIRSFVTAVEV